MQRQYADYYQVIKAPMSLEIIHRKLEAQEYDTLEAVRNDFSLIFNNAKRCKSEDMLRSSFKTIPTSPYCSSMRKSCM